MSERKDGGDHAVQLGEGGRIKGTKRKGGKVEYCQGENPSDAISLGKKKGGQF